MNSTQVRDALAYNRRQSFDVDELKLIQEVTGSTPDGTWGPRTVRAIALWQKEQGLDADGKVGTNTFALISNFDECPGYEEPPKNADRGDVTIGAWGDDAPSTMRKPAYADRLVELGISEVALMMNRVNISSAADPWDLRWKDRGEEGWEDDIIAEIADVYAARGIRLILTAWPHPDKAQIDEMCAAMVPLLKATNALIPALVDLVPELPHMDAGGFATAVNQQLAGAEITGAVGVLQNFPALLTLLEVTPYVASISIHIQQLVGLEIRDVHHSIEVIEYRLRACINRGRCRNLFYTPYRNVLLGFASGHGRQFIEVIGAV